MDASALFATAGQWCAGSAGGWGSGRAFRRPTRRRYPGIPGTTASYSANPAYAKTREATGGLNPGVSLISARDRANQAVATSAPKAEAGRTGVAGAASADRGSPATPRATTAAAT